MVKRGLFHLVLFLALLGVVFRFNQSLIANSANTKVLSAKIEQADNDFLVTKFDDPILFAALPSFDQEIKTSVKTADARPEIIRQYLYKYSSPLEPYANLIVELSDQYNFDYRWLVAIAQQESNLCRHIPENSYNCWGWGIYGEKVTRFDGYEDALRRIAPQFTKIFLKGDHNKDPLEVMKTYTPPSDGSWADGISTFFDHLD